MKLEVSVEVPFPRQRVFEVYRDKLVELLPYLPNVRGIQQIERTDDGAVSRMLNHWKGGGDIPAVARAFVSEKLLEWDDYATWNASAFTCDWRTEVGAFKEAVKAEGRTNFEEVGADRTRLVIKGVIEVDAKKVKAVPRLLAGTIGPAVESFLVATIKPNLVSVGSGLTKYLTANR
ncbi:MAG: hypothetical protein ACJ790_09835 [Myxococcaceae bacterium]